MAAAAAAVAGSGARAAAARPSSAMPARVLSRPLMPSDTPTTITDRPSTAPAPAAHADEAADGGGGGGGAHGGSPARSPSPPRRVSLDPDKLEVAPWGGESPWGGAGGHSDGALLRAGFGDGGSPGGSRHGSPGSRGWSPQHRPLCGSFAMRR